MTILIVVATVVSTLLVIAIVREFHRDIRAGLRAFWRRWKDDGAPPDEGAFWGKAHRPYLPPQHAMCRSSLRKMPSHYRFEATVDDRVSEPAKMISDAAKRARPDPSAMTSQDVADAINRGDPGFDLAIAGKRAVPTKDGRGITWEDE